MAKRRVDRQRASKKKRFLYRNNAPLSSEPDSVQDDTRSSMRASWNILGAFGCVLGASREEVQCARLEMSWARLEATWGRLGAVLERLGASWGRLGGVLERRAVPFLIWKRAQNQTYITFGKKKKK